jgi:hypothetical protein
MLALNPAPLYPPGRGIKVGAKLISKLSVTSKSKRLASTFASSIEIRYQAAMPIYERSLYLL